MHQLDAGRRVDLLGQSLQVIGVLLLHNGSGGRVEIGQGGNFGVAIGHLLYLPDKPRIAQGHRVDLGLVARTDKVLGIEHAVDVHALVRITQVALDHLLIAHQLGGVVAAHALVVVGSQGVGPRIAAKIGHAIVQGGILHDLLVRRGRGGDLRLVGGTDEVVGAHEAAVDDP